MNKLSGAVLLARMVLDQGGNLNTRLGGNCPTIGEVIGRALASDEMDTALRAELMGLIAWLEAA